MKFPQCAALPLKHILDLANWDQKYIVLEQSPFVIVNLMNDSVRSKKKMVERRLSHFETRHMRGQFITVWKLWKFTLTLF